MDSISKEKRSWNMSRIRSKDTRPEKTVRSLLHNMGYRFRLHAKYLPGTPDLVLPKYKTVLFVHGCFWHRHPGCKYAYTPKTRLEFWNNKFEKNITNNEKAIIELNNKGWRVLIIWECETFDQEDLKIKLSKLLPKVVL